MKKFCLFSAIALCSVAAFSPVTAYADAETDVQTEGMMSDQKIIDLSNKYVAMLSSIYPEEATRVGTLGYQNALNQRDMQTLVNNKRTLMSLKEALDKVEPKKLSLSKRIDYSVLNQMVNKKLFEIDVMQPASKDPLWYLDSIDAIYDVILKKYAPAPDRVRDGLKRLQALPQVLREAENNLDNPPDLRIRLAMQKANIAYTKFGNITTILSKLSQDEYTRTEVKKAAKAGQEAVKDYLDFLKTLSEGKPYVDFRMGEDNYVRLMKEVYHQNMPLNKLQKNLDKTLEDARQTLITALTPLIEPAFTDEERAIRTNKKGLIEIAPTDYYLAAATIKDAPKYKDLLDTYAKDFKEAVKFFNSNKIFPVGALQVVIAQVPPYLASKTDTVTYLPPFPLLTRQMGDVLVNVPSPKEADELMPKLFNYTAIKLSAAENINPGKNLMYSVLPEEGQVMRKVADDIFYTNGWINYSLDLALQAGYFDTDEEKLAVAWYNYKKAVLAVADVKMHTGKLNYTQTIDFIIDSGIQSAEAENLTDYIAMNPLASVGYEIGGQEFAKIKAKYQKKFGKTFDMQDYHKRVLMSGKIPMDLVDESVEQSYEKKEEISAFNMTYF